MKSQPSLVPRIVGGSYWDALGQVVLVKFSEKMNTTVTPAIGNWQIWHDSSAAEMVNTAWIDEYTLGVYAFVGDVFATCEIQYAPTAPEDYDVVSIFGGKLAVSPKVNCSIHFDS